MFFKVDSDPEHHDQWRQYQIFDDMRGQISFANGNRRLQVTTDAKIHFYIINEETLEPEPENVMYNFMECSTLIFGPKVRFAVSYK